MRFSLMRTDYYPWNVQVLIAWLKLELTCRDSLRDLAAALKVPHQVLNSWFKDVMPAISLQHIRNIAEYRNWSMQRTLDWLDIKPAHLEELIAHESLSDRQS